MGALWLRASRSKVVGATALAVISVVMVPTGTARAERLPGHPAPNRQSLGFISAPTVDGATQLGVSSTVTARAVVTVPVSGWRTQARISLSVQGRICEATRLVPSGESTLSVSCSVAPTVADLPTIGTTVVVQIGQVRNGVSYGNVLKGQAAVPINDGPTLTAAVARDQWSDLRARLQKATTQSNLSKGVVGHQFSALTVPGKSRTSYAAPVRGEAISRTAANAASAVYAQAQTSGWSSAATQEHVLALRALRNPDGGYGLNAAWDAYGDGTTNPADTSYTVTTAGHVGWVLIEAVKHGNVMREDLDLAIDSIVGTPRLTSSCLAYSTSRFDVGRPCVYNVNLAAGAFLAEARHFTNHRATEVDALVAAIRSGVLQGYDPNTGYWVYMAGNTTAQDIGHQLYTVRLAQALDPTLDVLSVMMSRPWWQQPNGVHQSALALSSAMIDVARDCRFSRSPAVLLGANRAMEMPLQLSTLTGMQLFIDEILADCL